MSYFNFYGGGEDILTVSHIQIWMSDATPDRIPKYSAYTLTTWYNSKVPEHTSRLLTYLSARTSVVLELIEVAEVVTKNA